MAVLEKIRVKFGLAASIIIALGLLSFIIDPAQLETAFHSMSSKYDVGSINGTAVSYTDFQQDVERYSQIAEMMTGSSVQSAQQQAQTRDAAWQELIYKHLFVKNAQAAGLYVGDEEMVDLTAGNDISPIIANNPAFLGEDGTYSVEAMRNFLSQMNEDETGRLRMYWNYLRNTVQNGQYFEKYASLFTASAYTNTLMLNKNIAENNNTVNVDFVMVPFGYQTDTTIKVSDSEIRAYYNSHKKFYKQPESRDIEYVVFEVKPSAEDIAKANNEIAALRDEFASTDNIKTFLTRNSTRPYSDWYYKKDELNTISSQINDFVWNSNEAVSPVFQEGNKFYIARVLETRNVPESAYVKHILLQGENESMAEEILAQVRNGENFATLATLYSADANSADGGERGNLGWLTQSYMIPGMEGVLLADINKPYIVKTQYGTHVVVVTEKKDITEKKKVAIFEKEAVAGKKTIDIKYAEANRFATAAAEGYDAYKKAADTLSSHPVNKMLESSERLGTIDNTKAITRWAFENKAGKVSNIITVDNNYFFVATVKAVHKEGYAKVSEVASSIRQTLYQEKLAEKKTAEVAQKIEGLTDIQAVAEALGSTVSSKEGIAFSSLNSQSLDPKAIGAMTVAPEGQVCGPVAGNIGVYVFTVTGSDTGSFFTEDDAKSRNSQAISYTTQMIIPVMMDDANVKDNRARFF